MTSYSFWVNLLAMVAGLLLMYWLGVRHGRDGAPLLSRPVLVKPGQGEVLFLHSTAKLTPATRERVRQLLGEQIGPGDGCVVVLDSQFSAEAGRLAGAAK